MATNQKQISVIIEKPIFGGDFLGRLPGNKPVFVPFVIPEEVVSISIIKEKKNYARGSLLSVQTPHASRINPPCKYFYQCGGCQYQHMNYAEQVEMKNQIIAEQFSRISDFQFEMVKKILPSVNQFNYRNNIQLSVDQAGNFGFQAFGSHKIIPIEECMLAEPEILQVWKMIDIDLIPGLRRVQIRKGIENEIMVIFESDNYQDLPMLELDVPVSVIHTSPAGKLVLAGDDHLIHQVNDQYFHVSAESFFQVNTSQTERMVETVQRYLKDGGQSLLELYCGVGLFTRFVANSFGSIHAIEESSSACDDFAINLDEFDHINLYVGSVKDIVPQLNIKPDSILLDPPRSGLDPETLEKLLTFNAKKLVYVSCDLSTLARDLQKLLDGGYQLIEITPIDMFPQTYHVECVVLLEKHSD